MARARFISTDYLYKNTIIDDNVDADTLVNFINKAQDINIQEALGYQLYNTLQDKVITNSVSNEYLTLLNEYVQPCLADWVVYYVIPFMNYRLTNKAVSKKSSDSSSASDLDELKWLQSIQRDAAEFLSKRIVEYIKNNESLLPEYSQTTGKYRIKPKTTQYFSGIYTKKYPVWPTDLTNSPNTPSDPCEYCD